MATSTYYNPVRLTFGRGSHTALPYLLQAAGGQNKLSIMLLFGTRSLKAAGHLDAIAKLLAGYRYFLQGGVPGNPDIDDILRFKKMTDDFNYNLIIAAGGGSVIDMAKALAALRPAGASSVPELREIVKENRLPESEEGVQVWALPTTAGSGSEVTPWATVWDREEKAKYSLADPRLFPQAAIVDPLLTVSLPAYMTASSALDALCHAAEAYWSKNSTFLVRLYALQAIKLITGSLQNLLADLSNEKLREKLSYASLLAGLAFSNTKTTACHSISYPLTLSYGIIHGVAASLTLGQVLEKNLPVIEERDALLEAFGVRKPAEVTEWVWAVLAQAGIPARLRDYGVREEDLPDLVDRSSTPGRMDNNPVEIDRQFLSELLSGIY